MLAAGSTSANHHVVALVCALLVGVFSAGSLGLRPHPPFMPHPWSRRRTVRMAAWGMFRLGAGIVLVVLMVELSRSAL